MKKFFSLFFEEDEEINKPIAYAKFILYIGAILYWFFGDQSNPSLHRAVINFIIGTIMLLIWTDKVIINKRMRADYLIWFSAAILFYWIAVDYYFFD